MLGTLPRKLGRCLDRLREYPIAKDELFPGLPQLPKRVRQLSIDLTFEEIAGWLSPRERRALYASAYWLDGPFLEIGSWVGLSTSCMARGIHDSGASKKFVANELNPSTKDFKLVDGRICFFDPADPEVCMGSTSKEDYKLNFVPFLEKPGGIIGCLKKNLGRNNLSDYVEIVEGDFRETAPKLEYRFVFCDCTHTPEEIQACVPHILPLMSSDCILACHDTNPENEECIRSLVPIKEACQVDSLFFGSLG